MAASKVAIRYASSFLDTAIEKKVLEEVYTDFELVYRVLAESSELRRTIKNPIVKNELKQSILKEVFKDKIKSESLQYLLFVLSKGRENILAEILEKFFDLRNEYLGLVDVQVTTSYEFTDGQKVQLQKKFEMFLDKKVSLAFTIDRHLIGGFVAKIGDTIYDASIIHQLELLKKQFLQGSIVLN